MLSSTHTFILFSSQAQKSNGCQSDDDDEDKDCNKKGWSDEDRLLVPPCIGLVKVSITGVLRKQLHNSHE